MMKGEESDLPVVTSFFPILDDTFLRSDNIILNGELLSVKMLMS